MGKKILAVDDDKVMLGFVSELLSDSGYEVVCAPGGREAISILEKCKFDCVVLDFQMAEKDGLDAHRAFLSGHDIVDYRRTVRAVFSGMDKK